MNRFFLIHILYKNIKSTQHLVVFECFVCPYRFKYLLQGNKLYLPTYQEAYYVNKVV